MSFRTILPSIALLALIVALTTTAAPITELELAPMRNHRAVHVHRTTSEPGLAYWDDVYPPAIYGRSFARSEKSLP